MPWVTINGNHVLIGEDSGNPSTGGGHTGSHDPATSTGHKQVDMILKSRLQPAVKITSTQEVKIGERGDYHSVVARVRNKVYSDYTRGFYDPVGKKYYDAQKIGLDATEIAPVKPWMK